MTLSFAINIRDIYSILYKYSSNSSSSSICIQFMFVYLTRCTNGEKATGNQYFSSSIVVTLNFEREGGRGDVFVHFTRVLKFAFLN